MFLALSDELGHGLCKRRVFFAAEVEPRFLNSVSGTKV